MLFIGVGVGGVVLKGVVVGVGLVLKRLRGLGVVL